VAGRLAGKVALVTGAARGQGEAEALRFAEEGAAVCLADVLDAEGEAVAAAIGVAARYVHLDVREPAQWSGAVAECVDEFGRLDVLVNNAGLGVPPRQIEDESVDEHHHVVDVNLHGVWFGMRAVIPIMSEQGNGSIVNISSIDGIVGVPGMSTYAATKFAVTGMTRSVALEVGRRGIRVNSIHPGVIATPLVTTAPAEIQARLERLVEQQAIPRMGTPQEVANLALFLASDESSYCTGAQFVIDGGHVAGPAREGFP
jgi:3alpha(or 20beta)-hydroxysteroid dehydrogenase